MEHSFPKQSSELRYLTIVMLHFLHHLLMYMLPISLIFIREDIDLNYMESAMLWTSLTIASSLFAFASGFIIDRYPTYKFLLVIFGPVWMSIGWYFLSFVDTNFSLYLVFLYIGIGTAFLHTPAMVIITELHTDRKSRQLSFFMAVGMIANAISPLIFSLLTTKRYNWQNTSRLISLTTFLIILLLVLLNRYHLFHDPSNPYEQNNERIENVNSSIKYRSRSSLTALSPIILAVLIYSIRESFFVIPTLYTALIYEDFIGLSKFWVGFMTSIILCSGIIFTLLGGFLSDNYGYPIVIKSSCLGTLIAAIGLTFFNNQSSVYIFSVWYFLFNASFYLALSAFIVLFTENFSKNYRGRLLGTVLPISNLISLFTLIVFGNLSDQQGLPSGFQFVFVLNLIVFVLIFPLFGLLMRLNGFVKVNHLNVIDPN